MTPAWLLSVVAASAIADTCPPEGGPGLYVCGTTACDPDDVTPPGAVEGISVTVRREDGRCPCASACAGTDTVLVTFQHPEDDLSSESELGYIVTVDLTDAQTTPPDLFSVAPVAGVVHSATTTLAYVGSFGISDHAGYSFDATVAAMDRGGNIGPLSTFTIVAEPTPDCECGDSGLQDDTYTGPYTAPDDPANTEPRQRGCAVLGTPGRGSPAAAAVCAAFLIFLTGRPPRGGLRQDPPRRGDGGGSA